ncbi:SDR family NAD(P)-dependent oxidoreductase [Arthrobacter sp. NPDC057009]|uniref:SDR family NAD(P)-dependent oxidoreductase n=1 Tax=Arthrobacter sp. NPDC057009 TaxID=3345996 RepID=UPI00362B85D8
MDDKMTTIAIIGAGRGLGAATAKRFGRGGFDVALISRRQEHVDLLTRDLVNEGIKAQGFAADVENRQSLSAALERAATELGPIEVLQYSPVPRKEFLRPVLETTADDLAAAVAFSILGPATAVQQVLGGMRQLGRGTILFVNGSSAVRPNEQVAGTSTAFAGESAYASMLHTALQPENIQVRQLIIPGAIGGGDPAFAPDALADQLWELHTEPGILRKTVSEN